MQKQRGIAMVEAMVAIFVLASGLLGLAALQPRALVAAKLSQQRGIAADLAADLGDRIRANRTPYFALDGTAAHPDLPIPPDFALCVQNSTPDNAPVCATQEAGHSDYLVATEMSEWNTALRHQLPNARYTLTSTAAQTGSGTVTTIFYRYTLQITWTEHKGSETGADRDITYTSVIE